MPVGLRSVSDFYPRPPRGGRHWWCVWRLGPDRFLSTPSARRATPKGIQHFLLQWNFYPRPPRGGRLVRLRLLFQTSPISIHALREEGDSSAPGTSLPARYFYPRPPRGGRRVPATGGAEIAGISIHALREEGDADVLTNHEQFVNFYPRPPRGGRLRDENVDNAAVLFLSTPSARRATGEIPAILKWT